MSLRSSSEEKEERDIGCCDRRIGRDREERCRRLDEGVEGLILAAVAARDITRAEAIIDGFARKVPIIPLAQLWQFGDVIVECAPAAGPCI